MIELFRTSTFRLAMFYLGLFATSVVAVLALIYWQTVVYADQQTNETIDAEITGLAEQYRQRGLVGLIEVVQERSEPGRGGNMLYLLTDAAHRPLAGNLSLWPDVTVGPDGWMRFPLQGRSGAGGEAHIAQATSFLLAGGYQLLVGRDLTERRQFNNRLIAALTWSLGLTVMLGLTGGVLLSRAVLARIEPINRASDRVMAGELGCRIPVRGTGDEFDRLAQNLNAMLDRIEGLMGSVRQVADNIAHDLRSPLGRLRTRLETVLRERSADPERFREIVGQAIADADQLLGTFSALLQIAEAEAGVVRDDLAPVELGPLLRDLVDFYEPLADDKGLSLTNAIPQEPVQVRGNRHLLGRAFSNLLDNALKYTPPPGSVTVTVAHGTDTAAVIITDSGPGIPAEARDRVFDRFVRLEQSRTSEGNGLGLSLARAVIGMHGGTIELGDNAPGLRVAVRLPLLAAVSQHAAPRVKFETERAAG